MTTAELARDTVLASKFRIEHVLGVGAFGAVYAIRHELTRHRRALKLLHPHVRDNAGVVQRFLNEASAAGRAGSPHLVEVFDAGTLESGEPYLVMELLEGETLSQLLSRQGCLEPVLAAELVAQAALGAEAAHRAGIIHRDLKPDNLFITQRKGAAFVKLLDFGVSKFSSESSLGLHSSRAGAALGTPVYMAPEQLKGDATLDGRADVFALGAVLFECLTGALPYDAPTFEMLAMRLLVGAPTRIETLRSGLPSTLVQIVHRAIAQDRDQRYPSAAALAEALSSFVVLPTVASAIAPVMAQTVPSVHPWGAPTQGVSESLNAPLARADLRMRGIVALALVSLTLLTLVLLHGLGRRTAPGATTTKEVNESSAQHAPVRTTLAPAPPTPPTPTAIAPEESVTKPSTPMLQPSAKPQHEPKLTQPSAGQEQGPAHTRAKDLGLAEENPFQ